MRDTDVIRERERKSKRERERLCVCVGLICSSSLRLLVPQGCASWLWQFSIFTYIYRTPRIVY